MQDKRHGYRGSDRSGNKMHGESTLTAQQEELIKRTLHTIRDLDFKWRYQDCRDALQETNFNFEAAIDKLISPDYHPWILNEPDKDAHKETYHEGSQPGRREHNERRSNNWSRNKLEMVKGEGSGKPATSAKRDADVISSRGDAKRRSPTESADIPAKKTIVIENVNAEHKEMREKVAPAQMHRKPIQNQSDAPGTSKEQAKRIVITVARPAEPKSESTSANTTPSKVHIRIASNKIGKTSAQSSTASLKSQGGNQKENGHGGVKQGETQHIPAIDVMTLEQNLNRTTDGSRQMNINQPPMVVNGQFPGFQAPVINGQPGQQGMSVVYVPVYYPNQMPTGGTNPFPPNGFPQMIQQTPETHGIPAFQMAPIPFLPGAVQGQGAIPVQPLPGQQGQLYPYSPFNAVQAPQMQAQAK